MAQRMPPAYMEATLGHLLFEIDQRRLNQSWTTFTGSSRDNLDIVIGLLDLRDGSKQPPEQPLRARTLADYLAWLYWEARSKDIGDLHTPIEVQRGLWPHTQDCWINAVLTNGSPLITPEWAYLLLPLRNKPRGRHPREQRLSRKQSEPKNREHIDDASHAPKIVTCPLRIGRAHTSSDQSDSSDPESDAMSDIHVASTNITSDTEMDDAPITSPTVVSDTDANDASLGESSTEKPTRPLIRVAIDYGTTFCKVAFVVALKGRKITDDDIQELDWVDGTSTDLPMIFTYVKRCTNSDPESSDFQSSERRTRTSKSTLVYGHELQDAIRNNQTSGMEELIVIRSPKLLLYHKKELPKSLGKQVENITNNLRKLGKNRYQLLRDFFRSLLSEIKTRIASTQQYGVINPDSCDYDFIFTVPILYSPRASREMAKAATKAGFTNPKIVREAFPTISQLEGTVDRHLKSKGVYDQSIVQPDTVYLVIDAGGSTVDATPIRLLDKGDLTVIGRPSSRICGAAFIDAAFLEYIRDPGCPSMRAGGVHEAAKTIGITEAMFEEQALLKFEPIKVKQNPSEWNESLTIDGPSQGNGTDMSMPPSCRIRLSKEIVSKLYDSAIRELVKLIRENLNAVKGIKVIYMSGGFARSTYLRKSLIKEFNLDPHGRSRGSGNAEAGLTFFYGLDVLQRIKNPVTSGMLKRYDRPLKFDRPLGYNFGISRDEAFDPRLHPDATLHRGSRHPDTGRFLRKDKPNMSIARQDPIDDRHIEVPSRWVPVLWAKTSQQDATKNNQGTWMYYPFEMNRRIFDPTVFVTQVDIKASAPMRRKDGEWRKDIHWFGQFKMPFDPSKHGFKLIPIHQNGSDCPDDGYFDVWYRLSIEWNQATVRIKAEIAEPESHPSIDGSHKMRNTEGPFKFLKTAYVDIRAEKLYSLPQPEISYESDEDDPSVQQKGSDVLERL